MSIKEKAGKADILLGVCSRSPNQDEEVDELCYKWLADVSALPAFVLVGDFNLRGVYWKLNTAERRQTERFLECVQKNFLSQLVRTAVAYQE